MQGQTISSHKALEKYVHGAVLPGLDRNLDFGAQWNARKGDLVMKNQGHFQDALPYFEKLLKELTLEDYHVSTGWQMVLFSNIADVYCEVGRPHDAEAVLEKELEIIYARGWEKISTGRRLQLALIESFIRRGMFRKAEECLFKLVPSFEAISKPDMIQNTGHFRLWTGLARILHLQCDWPEALSRWYSALGIVKRTGWTRGFNHGVIQYPIAQVLTRMRNVDDSRIAFEAAKRSLGSYWYDYVITNLGEAGPNPVVAPLKENIACRDHLINEIFALQHLPSWLTKPPTGDIY